MATATNPLDDLLSQSPASAPASPSGGTSGSNPLDDLLSASPSAPQPTGPDLRPQRINQRTGQPTTLEDPEGVDRIAADPNFVRHTAEGAGQAALATLPAMGAGLADPVVNAVVSHLPKLKPSLKRQANSG